MRALNTSRRRERVVAEREDNVRSQSWTEHDLGELVDEPTRQCRFIVIDEVLLELVEHEIDVAVEHVRPVVDDIREPGIWRRCGDRATHERHDLLRQRVGERGDRIVRPRSEHDHRTVRSAAERAATGELTDPARDARAEERALADPAGAIEDRQPRSKEVRDCDLGLVLAPEEEQ